MAKANESNVEKITKEQFKEMKVNEILDDKLLTAFFKKCSKEKFEDYSEVLQVLVNRFNEGTTQLEVQTIKKLV